MIKILKSARKQKNGMQKSLVKLHLFEAFGIELEYMIVDQDTLDVKPIADQLFSLTPKHMIPK